MDNKIILVGKIVTDEFDDIAEGYAQVEFKVDELLDEIDSCDVRSYAKDSYDLISIDDLSDCDEDDMVEELEDRGFNFIGGAKPEALINALEDHGYKCIYEYDKEYDDYLKVANLDIQDMNMLKEITQRFINASIFDKEDMYEAIMKIGY